MGLETMSSNTPSLANKSPFQIPCRSSSLPHDRGTGRSRTLSQVAFPTRTKKRALSERRSPPSRSRHELLLLDGQYPDLPLRSCSLMTEDSSRNLTDLATSGTSSRGGSVSCFAPPRKPMQRANVQRWDGLARTVGDWDALRRDPELFYPDGDCYVHLHARGSSRRGPSFCVPSGALRKKKCTSIISQCDAYITSTTDQIARPLNKIPTSLNTTGEGISTIQLYIPAPDGTSREDAFRWHVTTRNFFALLLRKPLVGEHMGQACVDLQERLFLYRSDQPDNHREFLDFVEGQGYRDLVECTDYALAMLYYAERYKHRAVWIDAFAHCVGMNESLALSPEYASNSRLTKALLTRANLEVELRLDRVWIALGSFLQEDLSPTYLGITDNARSHLDYFRQFLHKFYENEFGCWPPRQTTSFPKALYKGLCFDFQSLYDYLVDKESTSDISLQKPPTTGGLCVLQNVNSFDRRHGFKSQPYPLPLLPAEKPMARKTESQKALRQFTLSTQHNKTHQIHATSAALAVAANLPGPAAASTKIVEAYMHFERVYAMEASQRQEKISAIDARKVRWLLIYGTLQYLTSALRAPKEVRDHESPDYPLCCVAEHSSWHLDSGSSAPMIASTTAPSTNGKSPLAKYQHSPHAIEPDCNREDYFSSETTTNAPSRQSSHRSFDPRSLSVRSSRGSRRNSETRKPTQNFPLPIPDLTDSLDEAAECLARPVSSVYSLKSQKSCISILPDGAGPDTSWLISKTPSPRHSKMLSADGLVGIGRPRTPLLDSTQLGNALEAGILGAASDAPSRSDSTGSTVSSIWSEPSSMASSKSSADGEAGTSVNVKSIEDSGLLGGFVSVPHAPAGSTQIQSKKVATKAKIPQSQIHPLLRKSSRPTGFDFDFDYKQSGAATSLAQLSNNDPAIGVAISAVPSPPCPGLQLISSSFRAVSLPIEKPSFMAPGTTSVEPAMESARNGLKKTRSADLLSMITVPTSEMWEQYKTALARPVTQPESRAPTTVDPADATPPPISISKITQTFRVPSFRFPSKTDNPTNVTQKKENRLSSFWRR